MNARIDHSAPSPADPVTECPLSRSDRMPILHLDVGGFDRVGLGPFGSGRNHRTNFLHARDIIGQ
ncbi:hypothetical protein FHS96_005218 [Sphingomonas zeicaulis]